MEKILTNSRPPVSRDIGYLSSAIPCGRTPSNEGDFVKFPLENPNSPLLEGDIESGGSLCAHNVGKKVKTETMCSHTHPRRKAERGNVYEDLANGFM